MTMDTEPIKEMTDLKNVSGVEQKAIIEKIMAITRRWWYLRIPKQEPVFKRKNDE